MNALAIQLSEYPVLMIMCDVGTTFGPHLMVEISDVMLFNHREVLTTFAGVDPGKDNSGQRVAKSIKTSK